MNDAFHTAAQKTAPVPCKPEPLDALRRRYPAALARVFDGTSTDLAPVGAANVFDHEDGLRLVCSPVRDEHGIVHLLVSAAVAPGSTLEQDVSALCTAGTS